MFVCIFVETYTFSVSQVAHIQHLKKMLKKVTKKFVHRRVDVVYLHLVRFRIGFIQVDEFLLVKCCLWSGGNQHFATRLAVSVGDSSHSRGASRNANRPNGVGISVRRSGCR